MTDLPPHSFHTTVTVVGEGTVTLHLNGDLDYDTSEDLLRAVELLLSGEHTDIPHGVRELRLDCAEVRACDSMGLSTLLQVHRRATAGGLPLRLDHRTPALERLLDITGTLAHFTAGPGADRPDAVPGRAAGETDGG